MDDYTSMKKEKMRRDKESEAKYKELSKERLAKIACKKIQTTMIGALHSIEEHLGFLWDDEDDAEEANKMYDLYQVLRKEILDRGNTQIKNLQEEFKHYEIEWQRYTLHLPVKRLPRTINEGVSK